MSVLNEPARDSQWPYPSLDDPHYGEFAKYLQEIYELEEKETWSAQDEADYQDVVNPSHYTVGFGIEPIDFIMSNKFEFWRGNVIKYVSRAGWKHYPGKTEIDSEIMDLNKAIQYCMFRMDELQKEKEGA